ncbi:hypothetical protein [Bifidobacterium eulemuris]|uniref:Uncharacterized protein n=1 Tax=Bifidobacterium eulemuris TaxID=1765219 RepID=A0A261GBA0_9BIFI|nr:hypothetical protein [Bifidobacterium eulemuris]OZG68256.1 hypothetical protein BEUL_1269 [Bifidobacterium eulemuris]QOL31688.1 hypothetical protein BE0216_03845 [Bifidobacterium eulemuris]
MEDDMLYCRVCGDGCEELTYGRCGFCNEYDVERVCVFGDELNGVLVLRDGRGGYSVLNCDHLLAFCRSSWRAVLDAYRWWRVLAEPRKRACERDVLCRLSLWLEHVDMLAERRARELKARV